MSLEQLNITADVTPGRKKVPVQSTAALSKVEELKTFHHIVAGEGYGPVDHAWRDDEQICRFHGQSAIVEKEWKQE